MLNVQSMLHYCNDPVDKEKGDDDLYQAFAVMGIALVAMGEDVGAEMALRTFSNLVSGHLQTLSTYQYGVRCTMGKPQSSVQFHSPWLY